jgi:hypothetical protein
MLNDSKMRARLLDAACLLTLALIAAEYALNYNIFLQAIPHDTTYHIYAAQQMLDGSAIYRDVAIIKAPLADFATAFALLLGRGMGISDIMSARLMSLLTAIGTVCVTYWAGRVMFRSRAVGLLAGLLMAGWDFYGMRSLTGPEPKAFLVLFAMPAFVFIAQKRWLAAGICAALATLSWQPGLMVAALAVTAAMVAPWLETSRAPNAQRSRAGLAHVLRVLGGIAIPFGLVALYLGWNNALLPAWNATIGANLTHFQNEQARTPFPQILRDNFDEIFLIDARYCFSPRENWLWLTAAVGFFGIVVSEIETAVRTKRAPVNLERTPLILYTLGFCAFSLVDFDFCPDLFPLLPVAALSVGWLLWSIARVASVLVTTYIKGISPQWIRLGIVGVSTAVIVAVYLLDVRGYSVTGVNFEDQQYVVTAAKKYLAPDDTVLTFGDAIVPVELHLPNATKIVHLGSKSGLGVLAFEPGGFQGMIDDLDRNPPKLITLSRENNLDWTKPFYEWLDEHYEPAEVFPRANMRFFIRRP